MEEFDWLLPPLCAGFLALLCNIILGQQVLKRGIIFIDLAMAQVAALGMLIMQLAFHSHDGALSGTWLSLFGACGLALLVGALIAVLERAKLPHLEAMIGCIYVLATCVTIILISQIPSAHEHASSLLQGQLLWSRWMDVAGLATLALVLLLVLWLRIQWLRGAGFYILFAVSIPLLVQTLGVYLEFAMLVVPALAASVFVSNKQLLAAWFMGMLGILLGAWLSLRLDWPSGPAIVIMITLVGFLTLAWQHLLRKTQTEQA
ncbi:metal ABC transporter permease [Motilimonas eburnea]|uniref:metal ABC transporter permease n=1 Tax=Motilimonas eburnea TaxID=1737488 RepID=UPI001E52ACB8|nr:metal ABC transporter permease [Motilimonas eburnea]MCE2570073.1 metal ABC transporter permease [Motilimonas eburnea]